MPRILDARHDAFPLNAPFRISRGVRTVADVLTVTITQDGVTGRGEGIPYSRYSETIETSRAAVLAIAPQIAGGADRIALLDLLPPGAARNAVDCALWDLEAKLAGRSVADLIGAPAPDAIPSAITIGIDPLPEAVEKARRLSHIPLMKVKVDAADPIGRIRAIRAVAPGPRMIVDPNEAWNRDILSAVQDDLVALRVDLLEQPVPAADDAWLEGFPRAIPICADEAVHVAADLTHVAARYDVVNVKLDKSGGLTAALQLAEAALARGMGLMTGCMISTSLSIAAAMHVARLSAFVDLDGPLWLAEDRAGGVTDRDGVLSPPARGFWGTPI